MAARGAAAVAALALAGLSLGADRSPVRYLPYSDVRPIVAAHPDLIPPDLATLTDAQRMQRWPEWIARHDRDIRARLARGDEDTIVNWLLFGTSFTTRPRATLDSESSSDATAITHLAAVMRGRTDDLVRALEAAGDDERRVFARRLLDERGLSLETEAGRAAAASYLMAAVVRVANEQTGVDRELDVARKAPSPAVELDVMSRLFRTRGLSLDTSLAPNFALDESLAAMKASDLLNAGVRRIAIIGPGLDFSDKDSGFDFYPPQTLQPFAVLDSLRRWQLGPATGDPDVVLLDISPRVVEHVTRSTARAARNQDYTLQLPLATHREWLPSFRDYWMRVGDRLGTPVIETVPKGIADVAELRAVRVPATVVRRLSVSDVDVITERPTGGSFDSGFDLIVATNVFVYYDGFDKLLALKNISAMLRPGGFLLSNNLMPDSRASALLLAGSHETPYWVTRTPNQQTAAPVGDRVFWYQRPNQ